MKFAKKFRFHFLASKTLTAFYPSNIKKMYIGHKNMDLTLFWGIIGGISLLLVLILAIKLPAFISLLISSIVTGLLCGLNGNEVIETVKDGMGNTLSFVATVVGLGAMFGAILEKSGGAQSIAQFMVNKLGVKNAPTSMLISGFIIAIPVFFDVAFIILIPVIYALQKKTGKSLLSFAIPLLSGLAVTHAFIPPTPGPVAVAEILGADLGWVIFIGLIAGLPTALISGLIYGKFIAKKIHISIPKSIEIPENNSLSLPPMGLICGIIALPIVLILIGSIFKSGIIPITNTNVLHYIYLICHPFSALIFANIVVWYRLGILQGYTQKELLELTAKSLAPAGTIILLTGAGGVFKQVLVDTGAGAMLANSLSESGLPLIIFAFLGSCIIRVIQGSATVAMMTSAGLVAPLLISFPDISAGKLAALVISIASGASILSHVNDSGFWLVKQYLGLSVPQTFRSWSIMTLILALVGFFSSCVLFFAL